MSKPTAWRIENVGIDGVNVLTGREDHAEEYRAEGYTVAPMCECDAAPIGVGVRDALLELVACKDLKGHIDDAIRNREFEDADEMMARYAPRKSRAWEAARAALTPASATGDKPERDAWRGGQALSDEDARVLDMTIATLRIKAERDHDLHINNSDVAMLLTLLVNIRAALAAEEGKP